MSEWKAWCRACDDLAVRGDLVEVALPDGRAHRVSVEQTGHGLTLTARVATRGAVAAIEEPELFVWERNRVTQLVGFRIDKHDLLLGESWVPESGLTADELVFYVRHLAAECDRLEALLTGADVE
jgi:hypothetical protein